MLACLNLDNAYVVTFTSGITFAVVNFSDGLDSNYKFPKLHGVFTVHMYLV